MFKNFFNNILGKSVDGNNDSFVRGYNSPLRIGDIFADTGKFFTLNEVSLYVNKGILKRGEKVGQIKFRLFKGEKEILDDPILDLLDKTDWKLASQYRDIAGFVVIRMKDNGEVFRDLKKVDELEILNSKNVLINYDGDKISSFTYTSVGGKIENIPFEQCIYWINADPINPTKGVSLLQAGLYSIDTDNQLTKYQNAIAKNGGRTDTVITVKGNMTTTQLREAKENYKKDKKERENSDIPLFLSGDSTLTRLGLTPTELAYLETKKLYQKDMIAITGVPLDLLGLSSEQTYANADSAYRIFLRETIKPICDDLVKTINWTLVPMELELSYENVVEEDIDVAIKKINALYLTDSSTINERREIMGLEPLPKKEADDIYVSFAKEPLGTPAPEPTVLSFKKKSVVNKDLAFDKDFIEIYRKVLVARQVAGEKSFMAIMNDYFKGQESRVLDNLSGKKSLKTKSLVNDVFDKDTEINLAKNSVIALLKKLMIKAGKEHHNLIESEDAFRFTPDMEKWLDEKTTVFAKQINTTTFDDLKKQFAESAELAESRVKLIERIQNTYSGYTTERARTIARTEVHGATQKANMDSSAQAGITKKVWIWGEGVMGGVRPEHLAMDGDKVNIGDSFSNGLDFAGDPNGGAEETINCSCQTI